MFKVLGFGLAFLFCGTLLAQNVDINTSSGSPQSKDNKKATENSRTSERNKYDDLLDENPELLKQLESNKSEHFKSKIVWGSKDTIGVAILLALVVLISYLAQKYRRGWRPVTSKTIRISLAAIISWIVFIGGTDFIFDLFEQETLIRLLYAPPLIVVSILTLYNWSKGTQE